MWRNKLYTDEEKKQAQKLDQKRYYEKNKEKILAKNKEWFKEQYSNWEKRRILLDKQKVRQKKYQLKKLKTIW
jgi:hypothetical protein